MEALRTLPLDFDEIWVLGDLVNYGPEPVEVIEWVMAHAGVVVRGNHDHACGFDVDPRCSEAFREAAAAMKQYTMSVLPKGYRQYLRGLPLEAKREVDGMRVAFCHAVPSDPLYAYRTSDAFGWRKELKLAGADTLYVGHTHVPFVQRLGGRQVVNPGSLGQPKTGRPRACYAVVRHGLVELNEYDYPFEETIRKIEALAIPAGVKQFLASVLRNGGVGRRRVGDGGRLGG